MAFPLTLRPTPNRESPHDDIDDFPIEDPRQRRDRRIDRHWGQGMSSALNALDAASSAELQRMGAEADADLRELGDDAVAALRELAADSSPTSPSTLAARNAERQRVLDGEDEVDAEARRLFGNAFVDRLNREVHEGNTEGLRIEFTEETRAQLEREITLLRARQEERRKRR